MSPEALTAAAYCHGMSRVTNRTNFFAAAFAGALGAAAPAAAHPHVWVDAKAEVVYDAKGEITAVRNIWRFDDAYSAFASQGLDTNGDGKLSTEELKPLADINVQSLKDYAYFTFITADGGVDVDFNKPTEYWLQDNGGRLILFFTLPTKAPVKAAGKIRLEIYDPTFFVAFRMIDDKDGPIVLDGAPAACTAKTFRPPDMDPAAAAALAAIPADQRNLPPELQLLADDQTNGADITCP